MPGNYNKIVLVGNLTRDPETRHIATGDGVTKFSLAVNRRTKQGDETMFIDIVAWRKLGEVCAQYLKKGASVLIEGRLSIRSYDDKDGTKRKAVEVVASEMQMLGTKPKDEGARTGAHAPAQRSGGDFMSGGPDYGDDTEIPF